MSITFVNGRAKTERLRFTVEDDLLLLREVVSQNPYEQNGRWEMVKKYLSNHTGKAFSLRTIKEHVDHLLKLYMKNDKPNLKKTGTEQQYLEKEMLLLEISELQRKFKGLGFDRIRIRERYNESKDLLNEDFSNEPTNFSNDEDYEVEKAVIFTNTDEIPPSIVIKREPDSSPLVPESELLPVLAQADHIKTIVISTNSISKKRRRDDEESESNSLGYIKQPGISENELKLKQMELEKRKVQLEERKLAFEQEKFEFEKEMRKEKLKMEMNERQSFIRLMERQQNSIDAFLKQNLRSNDN